MGALDGPRHSPGGVKTALPRYADLFRETAEKKIKEGQIADG